MPEATEETDSGAWIWTRRSGSRDMSTWPYLANTVLVDSDELLGSAPILEELRSGRKVSFPPSDSVGAPVLMSWNFPKSILTGKLIST